MGALDTAIDGALDPLDGAIDGVVGDKRKANVYNAVQQNPDEFAQAAQLSRSTGLPAPVVARNLPQVKQRADLDALDGVIEQSPAVRKAMDDPTFAILARDDAETLAEIERTAGRRAGGRIGGPAYQRPDEMKASQGPEASFASVVSGMFSALPQGAEQTRQGMRMQFADAIGSPEMSIDAMRHYQRAQTETVLSTPQFDSLTAAGLYSGGVSLVQQAPGLAASILMRTPLPGLAGIGVQTEATAYGKYRSRGATPGEALAGGAGEGAVEVATELLPMSFLVNRFGKAGAGEFLAGLLAREIPSEQIATLVQDAIDTAVANPDKTWQQYLEERPEAAYQTLVATVAQAGAMGAISTVAQRVAAPTMQAEAAGAEAETLAQLSQLAAASKLRERDPQTFEQYVEAAAPGQEVYLDARTLQQSGVDLAALAQASPAVAAQITEALATGGDITIPVSEYAARLAGTDLDTALLPHLRASEDALSQDEAQRFYQGQAEEFKNAAAKVMEDKATDDAWQDSAKAVETQLLDQLQQTGRFTPDVNNAYATLMRDFYVATAARLGTTPEEMAARYPIRIAAQSANGGQVLSQEVDTPAGAAKPPLQRFFQSVTNLLKGGDPSGKEGQGRRQEVLTDGGTAPLDMGQFFQGTKVDQTFYSQLARAELMEGAPTPNSGELGSRALSKQDAGAASVRAVTGALKEPAQSGGGAGSKANATDIPASVQEAALKAARKEQDRLNEYDLQEEIRSIGNNGMLDISKLASIPEYWDAENEEFTQAGLKEIDRLTEEKARDNLNIRPINELEDLNDAHQFVQVEVMEKILDGLGIDYERNYSWSTSRYIMVDRGGDSEPLKLRFADHLNTARGQPSPDINVAPGGDTFMDAVAAVFFQPAGQTGNRAEIRFGEDITQQPSVIALFNNADLSSFLHEMGHFQLEVLAHIASQPNAPAEIVQDMERVLKWFGVPDLATWQAVSLEEKRPYHEQFARGFEQYLFEGRAPSPELTSVFQRFRAWLISVYKSIKALNVEISDDIRGVFDRLVATDEAIKAAEAARAYTPLFPDDPEAQALAAKATQDATDELQRRSLRDMRWLDNARGRILKQMQADAKAKRQSVEAEVRAEVRAQPIYAARAALKEGPKLSIEGLEDLYAGDGDRYALLDWKPLVDQRLAGKEGMHPDQAAEAFGFTSGDQLVKALLSAESEASVVGGMTDQRMLERYGDLSSPDTLARAVDEAIHNEARARFVATELKALNKAAGPVRAISKAAKDFAETMVARKQVKAIKPARHAAAETRAAKAAEKALAAGDTVLAADEKRNQLIQNYATRASYDALTEVDKALRYFAKLDGEGTRKNLDAEYLDQIDALLERFDFRKSVSNKDAKKRATLVEWVQGQRDEGFEPDIPPDLLAEAMRKPYKEMTLEELRGLVDTVKQIEHLGRLKRKLLTAKDEREFKAIRDEIAASIAEHAKGMRDLRTRNLTSDALKDAGARFLAMHRKMASVSREMDGFKDGGPMWEYLIRSMNSAGDRESGMRADATARLHALVKPLLASGKMGGKGIYFESLGGSFNREERIAIALNLGNAGNMQRLLDGEGWTMTRLRPLLDTITAEEAEFVQSVWDFFESYRPEIAAKERRIYGKEPVWVEPVPITLGGKELKGGYYPVKYDRARSERAAAHEDAESAKAQMKGAYTSATTRRSFTKTRAEEVTGRPLLYSFAGIYQGTNEVIHDLAWHEWLIDANRLVRSLSGTISTYYGDETRDLFKKAIEDIAAGDVPAQNVFERGINHLRMGATVAGLGWNFSTALLQPFGLTQSMVRIGPAWVVKGLSQWIKSPIDTGNDVRDRSAFMRDRARTMQREINEIQNQVRGSKLDPVRATFFLMIQKMQMVADMPTWLGAYEKAIAEGNAENRAVALADQAVMDAQGGGQVKDLAQIQRGGPLLKLWTNFYSFFNTTYNLAVEKTKEKGSDPKLYPSLAMDYLLLFAIPCAMVTLAKAVLSGDADDEDELVKKLAADQISYLLGTMVGLRELTAAMQKLAGVEQFKSSYGGPAGLRMFQEVDKLSTQMAQGEIDAALLKAINNTAGNLLHYPSGQVNRTAGGVAAIVEGKTDNPMAVLMGPPPKK